MGWFQALKESAVKIKSVCFNPSVGMGWFQASNHSDCSLQPCSFNPSVGMGWFQASAVSCTAPHPGCFNPSVGMGWFQANHWRKPFRRPAQFQSLSRDGVVSGDKLLHRLADSGPVSIPQSGWGGFRPDWASQSGRSLTSFNPSVGMGWFQAE